MAKYVAEIDNSNTVVRVIVVNDAEPDAEAWCEDTYGGTWKETEMNGGARKNYAGIGHSFDAGRNAFIHPKPFDSWILDEDTARYEPPIPMPDDGKNYAWDEAVPDWVVKGPPA